MAGSSLKGEEVKDMAETRPGDKEQYTREDIIRARQAMLDSLAAASGGRLLAGCCTQGCCDGGAQLLITELVIPSEYPSE
jgi:hypothetical protein